MTKHVAVPEGIEVSEPSVAALIAVHPDDILWDVSLSTAEKRRILASWASDARAVVGDPTLRQLPSGAIVRLHHIQRALIALDTAQNKQPARRSGLRSRRWKPSGLFYRFDRKPWDDDPDPPPLPAAAGVPGSVWAT